MRGPSKSHLDSANHPASECIPATNRFTINASLTVLNMKGRPIFVAALSRLRWDKQKPQPNLLHLSNTEQHTPKPDTLNPNRMQSDEYPLAQQVLDDNDMDIARPDTKQKKKRRIIILSTTVTAMILAGIVFFVLRLKQSPHHEYVTLRHDNRTIQTLVVLPKVKDKAPVVILVHEVFGLTDWAKNMADELAEQGFIVIAPDLLSGYGPNGGGFNEFGNEAERVSAVSSLDLPGVLADLDAAVDYGKQLPAANGKIAVVGFSWGGWRSFAFATHRKDLSAVFVFYGAGPDDVSTITAPVYAFYGGEDGGVDGSIPATQDAMKAARKFYSPITYEGAGHGFMRTGEDHGNKVPANKTAHDQAFTRLIKLLREM